jgi:hypothetical protein
MYTQTISESGAASATFTVTGRPRLPRAFSLVKSDGDDGRWSRATPTADRNLPFSG